MADGNYSYRPIFGGELRLPFGMQVQRVTESLTLGSAASRIRRIEAVVNPASGSVGPHAAEQLEKLLSEYGFAARVCEAEPREIAASVRAAVDAAPDLVIILAGDGTAALAAERAGPTGPLVAPLPGGTMNMLPHGLYGMRNWQQALVHMFEQGEVRAVSGGLADEHPFYVAAILGSPALWAKAREHMRAGRISKALARSRYALRRAFSGSLKYRLNEGEEHSAEALSFICPLVSMAMHADGALEAAALDPKSGADIFRLGFNALRGAWRDDPAVVVEHVVGARVEARGHVPAVLDGEPIRLSPSAQIRFNPNAFRTLAPPPAHFDVLDPVKIMATPSA